MTTLPPGHELDRLVAEKVMGFEIAGPETGPLRFVQMGNTLHPDHVPPYSTDISHAWDVLERLDHGVAIFRLKGGEPGFEWCCQVGPAKTYATTAPHAICLAALKAVS